jgi:hypothetical protein
VKVEMTIGARVLGRERLAVRAHHEPRELLVGQLFGLLGRDWPVDPESSGSLLPLHSYYSELRRLAGRLRDIPHLGASRRLATL